MFKQRDIVIALMAAATLLSACKRIDDPTTSESGGLTIAGSVMAPPADTKYAGGANFAKGDQISLYALERKSAGEVPILKPDGNHFNNSLFERGDYYFEHKDIKGEGKLGFPTNGSMMDLYAIYPHHADIPTTLPVIALQLATDQTTEAKMLANDVLRAANLQVKPQLQPVNLEFAHAMAKFVVMVSRAQKYEDDGITVEEIRIKQLITKSLYNIQDATADVEATPVRADIQPLTSTTTVDGKVLPTRTMILPPQELRVDQVVVEIVMSNKKLHTFGYDASAELKSRNLASGTVTTLNIEVSPGSTQTVVLNGTMKDWNTGEVINETLQQKNATEFVGNLTAAVANEANAKWAKVTVEYAADKARRTYDLPVTYAAGTPAKWNFAFSGVGNRPNAYPYTVKTVQITDAAGVSIYNANLAVANVVSGEGQTVAFATDAALDYRATPANCYTAYGSSKVILFNALKKPIAKFAKGNATPVNVKGSNPSTVDAGLENDITYQVGDKLEVAWQTAVNHGTAGGADNMVLAYAGIDGEGSATVVTRGVGNAVLSYKRGGVVLWNYHIWVTDTDPFTTFYATGGDATINGETAAGVNAKFMDRNLGALSSATAKPDVADAYKYFGVLYQHGRPTPFSGQGAGTIVNTSTNIYDGHGVELKGTIEGYTLTNSAVSTVTEAIQTPNTFYWLQVGVNAWDCTWYNFADLSLWSDYGANKSIYDPCPYGYRVPNNGSWTGWTSTTAWTANTLNEGAVWSSLWWSAAGHRNANSGALINVGNGGYYWSSSRYPVAAKSYNLYCYYTGTVSPSDASNSGHGFPVRCVQEGY